jgi:hypothetical protein
MKRYKIVGYGGDGQFHEPFLLEDPNGEVVKAEDAMLTDVYAAIHKRDILYKAYDRISKLPIIKSMHSDTRQMIFRALVDNE